MRLYRHSLALIALQAAANNRPIQPSRHGTGQRIRPFVALFKLLSRVAPSAKPRIQKALIKTAYQALSARGRNAASDFVFMNYGYVPPADSDPALIVRPEDEADRYSIQLYHRVAAATDLRDKDVLEIGCGRGGGAAYIMRYLQPRSVTGVDLAGRAIAFCEKRFRLDGLFFRQGDAECLPFPDNAFDAVVNVESSHTYPAVERFLAEVKRVLRPGGYFLLADIRPRQGIDQLRDQIDRSGLNLLETEQITSGVARALELDSDRRQSMIQIEVPRFLRGVSREFLGVKGSQIYEAFSSGDLEYLRFVLQKPWT